MDAENNIMKDILEEIKTTQILIRTNNLLLSRFILQLSEVRKELGLPKKNTFFKFELDEDDYYYLVDNFGEKETQRALIKLDRLLLNNKQEVPNNIKRYIEKKLRNKNDRRTI